MLGLTVNSKLGGTRSSAVEHVTLSMVAESWNQGGGRLRAFREAFGEDMMKTKRSCCIASSFRFSDTDLVPLDKHGDWVSESSVDAFGMDKRRERGREKRANFLTRKLKGKNRCSQIGMESFFAFFAVSTISLCAENQ